MNLCLITLLQDNQTRSAEELTAVFKKGIADGEATYALITDTEVALREVEEKLRKLHKEPRLHTLSLTYILSRYDIRIEPSELKHELGAETCRTVMLLYAMHYLGYDLYRVAELPLLPREASDNIFNVIPTRELILDPAASDSEEKTPCANCASVLGLSAISLGSFVTPASLVYDQRVVKGLFSHLGHDAFHALYRYSARQKDEAKKALPLSLLYKMFIARDLSRYGYTCRQG